MPGSVTRWPQSTVGTGAAPRSGRTSLGTGVELVSRSQVVLVRDEGHALAILRRHTTNGLGLRSDEAELQRLARALARGELLLLRRAFGRPLDPPDSDAVPLLSELSGSDLAGTVAVYTTAEIELPKRAMGTTELPPNAITIACNRKEPLQLPTDHEHVVLVEPPSHRVPLVQAEDIHFGNERVIFLPRRRCRSRLRKKR